MKLQRLTSAPRSTGLGKMVAGAAIATLRLNRKPEPLEYQVK